MNRLKTFIENSLCNRITGSLILAGFKKFIPDIRSKNFSFIIHKNLIQPKNIASIFFGFYERGEIRFINKYLNPLLDVIELGASLGIVSSHIIRKLNKQSKLLLVEANPFLESTITANVTKHNTNQIAYKVLNYAVSYNADKVKLRITSDNTESRVIKDSISQGTELSIETISLLSLVNKLGEKKYALVCDIEGSEIEWIIHESECLNNCQQLLIELHAVDYGKHYSVDDIKNLIIDKHKFKLIDNRGPVCYFEK